MFVCHKLTVFPGVRMCRRGKAGTKALEETLPRSLLRWGACPQGPQKCPRPAEAQPRRRPLTITRMSTPALRNLQVGSYDRHLLIFKQLTPTRIHWTSHQGGPAARQNLSGPTSRPSLSEASTRAGSHRHLRSHPLGLVGTSCGLQTSPSTRTPTLNFQPAAAPVETRAA